MALPDFPPSEAVTVAVPSVIPAVVEPEEKLILATEVLEEVQVMVIPVIVLPNWSLGAAVNC